ncbi:16S rRNA (guanine(527)-N(7))-methyltransferase RsmG [Liquorilactobacillus oeni]|uniref:Ribosomal RNA small subunit methyltransferase G n=1 Tax=Liquorilactobacillus oeni DSM 19972 TaxID=1423777 RepID=A0A0R1MBI9_9LACO|nr:16S rRNA (guanine(527)-N(7))-methyltransferase RsmG [Liquorilactobacillus oeni]KRL05471.1 16S rRNA methyltransferase GidB [Liquorilactobacillus oeni DSM 19972]
MTPEEFTQTLAKKKIVLTQKQQEQFNKYFKLLVKTNSKVNLTAITAEGDVYLKHFFDSLLPALAEPRLQTLPLRLCDVGAGAGFPSIPLKICFPQLQVTIVDSLNKRIAFLQELAETLGLEGVSFYHARAEEFASAKSEFRESFDVVTARAVARLNILSELCLPLVKIGGDFVALKAQKAHSELAEAQYAVELLGGSFKSDSKLLLPETGDERHLIVFEKVKETPKKYPRKPGMPAKKPLKDSASRG